MAAMTETAAEMKTETPEATMTVAAAMKASGEEASARMTMTAGAEQNSGQNPALSRDLSYSIRMQAAGAKSPRAAATVDGEQELCRKSYT